MDKLNFDKINLRKFGITMGSAFLVIAGIVFLRHRQVPQAMVTVAGIFFLLGGVAPFALKPVYIAWMRLAFVLSWINTRLILFILFYLIVTPIGLVMRLFGRDILDWKIEKAKESYWHKKGEKTFSPSDCQRQF